MSTRAQQQLNMRLSMYLSSLTVSPPPKSVEVPLKAMMTIVRSGLAKT